MSPARKKATSTRHAKAKRAAKRSGRRARAKRAAGKRGRAALASHIGSSAAKRAAKRSGRRASAGRGRKGGSHPRLAIVARPVPKKKRMPPRAPVEVTEFSGAKSGASPKDLALFGLERARVAVHAAIQGLGPGAADRPIAPGKGSPRQIVLHLASWDREIVQKHLEPAAARNQRADLRGLRLEAGNAAGPAPLGQLDWEAAKRLLQTSREDLWDALDSIPAEPAEVWSPEHAVGELVREVTDHDRHQAEIIKRWRAESGA